MAVLRRYFDVLAQKIEDGDQVEGRGCDDNLCGICAIRTSRARLGVKVLTSVRIECCVVECFDQRPLCIAGHGVHLEITSDEKLAIHGC